jgi:hypothetical protein
MSRGYEIASLSSGSRPQSDVRPDCTEALPNQWRIDAASGKAPTSVPL